MALFIDTETNGLPDTKGLNLKWGTYPYYKSTNRYNDARVIQFSFMLTDEKINELELNDFIIKKEDFDINNSNFHGITNEISLKEGVDFDTAIDKFYDLLKSVTHIVAHNILFDINVIKSELYRRDKYDIIQEIDKKKLLCTMSHTKDIIKIKNKYGKNKNPSLKELYYFTFNKEIDNQHNSKYDVINMHSSIKKMYDDNILNYSIV